MLSHGLGWRGNSTRLPFANKVVAVTGAGSGIGRALSYAFAERGASLALNDVNSAGVIETAEGVGARGQRATYKVFDVTEATEFSTFAQEVVAAHGGVDILVNNAGMFSRFAVFPELSAEEFGRCFAVNFLGVVNGSRAFLPYLLDRTDAWLINMSSSYGFALLRMDDRLKPFMYGRLTQSELIDAVLSTKVTALPRAAGRKRRNST